MDTLPKWTWSRPIRLSTWMGFLFDGRGGTMETKTIMIIDDDANARRSIRYVLKSHGYRVVEAPSGPEALRHLHQQPVHLVILDLVMPEMDGLAVCDHLKTNPATKHLPVIIFTVMRGELCRDWKQYAKADACLAKPFQVADLLMKVTELLDTPGTAVSNGPLAVTTV
jgi:CheY-like chemotaxis protein